MGFHKKALTWNPFIEDYVDIDVKVAELIALLWENSIQTSDCCQNRKGRIWIQFFKIEDAEKFINILLKPIFHNHVFHVGDWIFGRIMGTSEEKDRWVYSASLHDRGYKVSNDNNGIEYLPMLPVNMRISVLIPQKDYNAVIDLFRKGLTMIKDNAQDNEKNSI